MILNDEYFMNKAFLEAKKAYRNGEVPIGCIITDGTNIIARAYNTKEKDQLVISHAEINAIKKANKKLGHWQLDNLIMYVTCEPCAMCAGAILSSRIKRLVYATKEPKFGAFGSIINLNNYPFNHHLEITELVMEERCSKLMKDFFKSLRH